MTNCKLTMRTFMVGATAPAPPGSAVSRLPAYRARPRVTTPATIATVRFTVPSPRSRMPAAPGLRWGAPARRVRTQQRDGYDAVQLGFRDKKREKATRPERGHVSSAFEGKRRRARAAAGVALPPKPECEPQRYVREFRLEAPAEIKVGDLLKADQVFKDIPEAVVT